MERLGDPTQLPAQPERVPIVRFCPYCGQMSFDISNLSGDRVYCEFCGVDVKIEDLVEPP